MLSVVGDTTELDAYRREHVCKCRMSDILIRELKGSFDISDPKNSELRTKIEDRILGEASCNDSGKADQDNR